MSLNQLREELINYVVKSTQHVLMTDPQTLKPFSRSGCLIIYRDRLFFVSVQHVTDKEGRQAALDTGTGNEHDTNVLELPALHFIDPYRVTGTDMPEADWEQLRSLAICYTEITEPIEIKQKQKNLGGVVITEDFKRMIFTNLDYKPGSEEGYSFHGRIRAKMEGTTLQQADRLVLGMKYDGEVGHYERFLLAEDILDELDFKGTIGAPVFSETGEPVALVVYGTIGEKYLYGFSMRELKKHLDIHLDPKPEINLSNKSWLGLDEKQVMATRNRNFSSEFEVSYTGESDPGYFTYPLFFGTNRQMQNGEEISFKNTRSNALLIGTCEVSIPRTHEMCQIERPGWFEGLIFGESPEKHFTILDISLKNKKDFSAALSGKIGQSSEKDTLLFIHGYNVEFEEAMFRTAQLGYDLNFKGAVCSFSWPSAGKTLGYVADTDAATFSSHHLADFLKLLLQASGANKIHLIAHSMGNVVLTNALRMLKSEGIFPNAVFNEIILAAPDIDKDIFIHQIMPEIQGHPRLTLYASDRDKALLASKKIRQGYIRVGEGGENIVLIDGIDSVDASNVDTSWLGHGYFSDTQPLIHDIHLTLKGMAPEDRILDPIRKNVGGVDKLYWTFRNS